MKAVAVLRPIVDLLLSFVSVTELEVVGYIVVLQQMWRDALPPEDVVQIIVVGHLVADHQVETKRRVDDGGSEKVVKENGQEQN